MGSSSSWNRETACPSQKNIFGGRSYEQGRRQLKVDKDDGDESGCNVKIRTKSKLSTEAASRQEGSKGVRCAERGGSAMMVLYVS